MFDGKKISVVMPAYNEEDGIYEVITEFKTLEPVDEILVVDNNSTDKTKDLALKAGARVAQEDKQGYGYACQRALIELRNSKSFGYPEFATDRYRQ